MLHVGRIEPRPATPTFAEQNHALMVRRTSVTLKQTRCCEKISTTLNFLKMSKLGGRSDSGRAELLGTDCLLVFHYLSSNFSLTPALFPQDKSVRCITHNCFNAACFIMRLGESLTFCSRLCLAAEL